MESKVGFVTPTCQHIKAFYFFLTTIGNSSADGVLDCKTIFANGMIIKEMI